MGVVRYGSRVWLGSGCGSCLTPDVKTYNTGRLLNAVRERTPDEWWERAADIYVAQNDPVPIWDGAVGFMDYFGDEGAFSCLPAELVNDLTTAMFEAAREAGFDVLGDFARRLVPVIKAIDEFRGAP